MDKDRGVLTIAATNVLEELDQALIRPGRFDRKIAIPLPNYDDRLAIIRLYAKKRSMTEDVSLEAIARQTVGMSGSSINTLFNEASIQAVMENRSVITREDIDMALTQMITNGEISKTVDKDELEMVAYHEAGHALLARLVANDPVQKVTIIGNTAGACLLYTSTKNAVRLPKLGLVKANLYRQVSDGCDLRRRSCRCV